MTTTSTPHSLRRRHHSAHRNVVELPAPRGRTLLLATIVFSGSLLLTGWIGGKEEDALTARLTASSTIIKATHDGRLAELVAEEGKTVESGGALVRLDNENLKQEIAAAKRTVELREIEWRQALAKADVDLTWRTRAIEGEILQTRLRMTELLQRQYDQQIEQQAWKDRLAGLGTLQSQTSPDDVFHTASFSRKLPGSSELEAMIQHEANRNAAEVSRVKLQLCKTRLSDLKALKTKLPERIRKAFGVGSSETRLQAAKDTLAALEARDASRNVVSNRYGKVGKYRRQVGEFVKAGDPLVEVSDLSQRFLIVEVPAKKLAQVLQAKIVKLRFPGGEKFEGKVGGRIDQPAGSVETGTSHIRIEPAGKLWPDIPLGSAVDVILEPGE